MDVSLERHYMCALFESRAYKFQIFRFSICTLKHKDLKIVIFLSGILVGPIIGRAGGHMVMLVGSILGSVGCLLSYFAPNIYVLVTSFGVLTGNKICKGFEVQL